MFQPDQLLPFLLVTPGLNKYLLAIFALLPFLKKIFDHYKDKEFFARTTYVTYSNISYSNGLYSGCDINKTFKAISHAVSTKINQIKFPHTITELPDTDIKVIEFNSTLPLTSSITVALTKDTQNLEKRDKNYQIVKYTFKLYPKNNDTSLITTYLDKIQQEYDAHVDKTYVKIQKLFLLESFEDTTKYARYSAMNFHSNKTFDNLFFEGKDALLQKVDFFLQNKPKYDALGIPYTLGMLFHGEPGTGKTSTIKALANYTNRHIVVLSTKNIHTYDQLKQCLTDRYIGDFIIPFEKRLYVIEEIDCSHWEEVVQSRKIEKKKPIPIQVINQDKDVPTATATPLAITPYKKVTITLSDLLELLDGIIETPGRMIIFTTNHPEKLDSALLRPGRVDINLHFKRLTRTDTARYYHLWYNKTIDPDLLLDYKYTQAELGELFSKFTAKEAKEHILRMAGLEPATYWSTVSCSTNWATFG